MSVSPVRVRGTIVGKLVATPDEVDLLATVLREVRHAMATGDQLSILIDPYAAGDGLNLGFHYNGSGWTRSIGSSGGGIRRARKRVRRIG
jgi:hypothetical protein